MNLSLQKVDEMVVLVPLKKRKNNIIIYNL